MMVSWSPLTAENARGYLSNYTVYYWPITDDKQVMNITVPHNTTSVFIPELIPGEEYKVEVLGTTGAGSGERSIYTLSSIQYGKLNTFSYIIY